MTLPSLRDWWTALRKKREKLSSPTFSDTLMTGAMDPSRMASPLARHGYSSEIINRMYAQQQMAQLAMNHAQLAAAMYNRGGFHIPEGQEPMDLNDLNHPKLTELVIRSRALSIGDGIYAGNTKDWMRVILPEAVEQSEVPTSHTEYRIGLGPTFYVPYTWRLDLDAFVNDLIEALSTLGYIVDVTDEGEQVSRALQNESFEDMVGLLI